MRSRAFAVTLALVLAGFMEALEPTERPWDPWLADSPFGVPVDSEVLGKVEESGLFHSHYSYMLRTAEERPGSCEDYGMRTHVRDVYPSVRYIDDYMGADPMYVPFGGKSSDASLCLWDSKRDGYNVSVRSYRNWILITARSR